MSSKIRENSKPRGDNNPSCSNIVKRMVSLPRSILGGVSRAMGHGFDLMLRDRRSQIFPPRPPPPPLLPPHFPLYPPQYDPEIAVSNNNEWSFLDKFEQDYGPTHPFFYACRFVQALKIAQDEKKFMFMYLHNADHPFAAEFCRGTLCSEVVVQFIDANFVSWGGLCDRGEGLQMSGILRPASFPFCAVIAPASGDNIAVLQQIEGPVSPAELVEILQRTLEEQGVAFASARAEEEERRRADRRLREEQDAAYFAALKLDQERERLSNLPQQQQQQQTVEKPGASVAANASSSSSSSSNKRFNQWPRHDPSLIKPSQVKESTPKFDNQNKNSVTNAKAKDHQVTQILIRFPNGERRENSFSTTDKVQAIYKYIDSLGLAGIKNYRLISSFPRKVFGADQMSMTLKDAGLHPRATLFLEPL